MSLKKAIFIVGLAPRSGTNFLCNLVNLHPDVERGFGKGEDFLLYNSDQLIEFTDKVNKSQLDKWGNEKEPLYRSTGKGLLDFLSTDSEGPHTHVVTKTPFPKGIENFKKLFPDKDAYLVILSRDGKDTIESYERSFKRGFNRTLELIYQGALEIVKFKNKANADDYILLKYEDVVKNHEEYIREILTHCGLSIEKYPFSKAAEMGVIGSSSFKRDGDKKVSWQNAQTKDSSFDPTKRSENWTKWQHQRFSWRTKGVFKELGYEKVAIKQSLISTIRNIICDMKISSLSQLRYLWK